MTIAILRAELGAEAEAGFPLLRRTPCTGTVALIDYYEDQDAAGRVALLDGLAEVGAGRVGRYAGGYRYTSVKLIAMMRRDPRSWAMFQQSIGRAASVELIPDIDVMVPAKAPLLRKLCKGMDLGWDVLTEENAERSIGVLREHLERLRGLLG